MNVVKKLVFFACLGMFFSCSQELSDIPLSGTEIRFGQEVNSPADTRGTAVTGTGLPANSKIGIYGYKVPDSGAPEYPGVSFDGSACTVLGSGGVNYGTARYWPTEGKLKFLAYYPHQSELTSLTPSVTAAPTDADAALLTLGYTADADATTHKDVMFACVEPLSTPGTPVALNFSHALTRLTFQMNIESGWSDAVVVTKIEITNIQNKGTLVVPATTPAWDKTSVLHTSSYSAVYDAALTSAAHQASQYLTQTGTGSGDSFMVIPMGNGFAENAQLSITYTVNDVANVFHISLKELCTTNTNHRWDMGKHVNYQLTIKKKHIIEFSVSVAEWGDPVDINLPWTL